MKTMLKKKLKSNKGFTMVEMIVVIAILGIFLTVGVVGLLQWQRYSAYKRNNEYAQSLFSAAQSGLTHYKAAGRLEEFWRDSASSAEAVPEDIAAYSDCENTLYYLDIKQGDTLDSDNPLYVLLSPYVYGRDIFEASIRLEFDPVDGVAYSLSYCDRAQSFDYSDADGTASDGIMGLSKSNREESRRRKIMLGYYDTTMSGSTPSLSGKLNPGKVELINADALYLQITFATKEEATFLKQYAYTADIYDESGTRKFSLQLNGDGAFASNNITAAPQPFMADVTYYDSGGQETSGTMQVEAYCSDAGQVCIILDAVDLQAADELDEMLRGNTSDTTLAEVCADTCSILRFGIEPDSKVKAAVKIRYNGQTGPSKSTGENHPLMGEKSTNSDRAYQVLNARHLFNIRFMEYAGAVNMASAAYTQMADIIWNGAGGIVDSGLVYDGQNKVTGSTADFVPIRQLTAGSSYQGKDEQNSYTIQGLKILQERVWPTGADVSGQELYATGLFRINKGSITNVTFSGVAVQGTDYVGTVCGINYGMLSSIVINKDPAAADSNYVVGRDYVGGIAGSDKLNIAGAEVIKKPASYTGLVNGAAVSGHSYVGGIIGYSVLGRAEESQDTASKIQDCENKGSVTARAMEGWSADGYKYFGGIAGYKDSGEIVDCTSSTEGVSITTINSAELPLLGDYVGGIAGCVKDAGILGCSTGSGVLFGRNYVGGIVGFFGTLASDAAFTGAELNGQSGKLASSYGTNGLTLIGEQYVGGIIGASAKQKADGTLSDAVLTTGPVLQISNWRNDGLAIAAKSYSGGISGYNTGIIRNCSSNTDTIFHELAVDGTALLKVMEAFLIQEEDPAYGSGHGYAGGIAGYNNGELQASSKQNITAVVAGRNYTGGIIGYNDTKGKVDGTNYNLAGGYIRGDRYVGGLVGLNASSGLFSDSSGDSAAKALSADPHLVEGNLCVGGMIGANLIAPDMDKWVQCAANNEKGTVMAAKGIAGGYIGYNSLFANEASINAALTAMNAIPFTLQAEETVKRVLAIAPSVSSHMLTLLDTTAGYEAAAGNTGAGTRTNRLKMVGGGICAGGIMGYNAAGSRLTLTYLTNKTEVKSTDAISSATDYTCLKNAGKSEPAMSVKDGVPVAYAYTGGIIGLAENTVTIRDCISTGALSSEKGTYTGAITEVNKGTVIACHAGDFGRSADSYVGGIVGRNEGTIYNSNVTGAIRGANVVGGIAAENYGTISNNDENGAYSRIIDTGKVSAGGVIAGGVAGFNAGTIERYEIGSDLSGNAGYFGGIAGVNAGTVRDVSMVQGISIGGNRFVGGYIGWMWNKGGSSLTVSGLTNLASVTAENGYAGGIVGYVARPGDAGEVVISECYSYGSITAANANDAGGITAYNSGTIEKCGTYGDVTAANGIAGGIAAVNASAGTVRSSTVAAGSEPCVIHGGTYAGGIVGLQQGNAVLTDCENAADLYSNSAVTGGIVGGITELPENGTMVIQNCKNYGTLSLTSAPDAVGGIVGKAFGSVTSAALQVTNCINTGNFTGSSLTPDSSCTTSAGIIGVQEYAGLRTSLAGCRNYGNTINGNGSGIFGAVNGGGISISHCFGVRDLTYPVTNSALDQNESNCYFSTAEKGKGYALRIPEGAAPFSAVLLKYPGTVILTGMPVNPWTFTGSNRDLYDRLDGSLSRNNLVGKRPLDSIGAPDVTWSEGTSYDIAWSPITSADQLEDLIGYEIKAYVDGGSEPITLGTASEGSSSLPGVDLNAYSGRTLQIYVIAVAVDAEDVLYTNSAQGALTILPIP